MKIDINVSDFSELQSIFYDNAVECVKNVYMELMVSFVFLSVVSATPCAPRGNMVSQVDGELMAPANK